MSAGALVVVGMSLISTPVLGQAKVDRYLEAVKKFADRVLEYGRDTYGPRKTPLFVDGINVDTLKPPVWKRDGEQWILSNLASQQVLMRVLDGLSAATGDPKYRNAAISATRYAFEHLRDAGGMLYWGGHWCYDALGDRLVGESKTHEFKHHYPYYQLMWQVDPDATRKMIEAVWAAHVLDWENLDFNRHGKYGGDSTGVWDHRYKGGKVPFVGKGLTFMMSGTDLIYAAAMLSHLSGDPKPLVWAERLAKRYVDARHPVTGLGAENFSDPELRRVEKQFPQFQGRFTEATVTDLYGARYTYCAACQLRLGEALGPKGKRFLQWGIEDLTARARYGYDEATNSFWAMLIDGTKLTPEDRKLDGYVEARWLDKRPADSRYFFTYALAYKLSKNQLMWDMVRKIGRGLGLGDLGEGPGKSTGLNLSTPNNDALIIFGLLELWEATNEKAYLTMAEKIADNALETRVQNGFFVESKDHVNARFDDPLPLALLHLRAAVLKLLDKPPAYWLSRGYLHCPYDGKGRTYDRFVIYSRLRGEPEP
ncbi:MAG: pectate lyase [Armatimonadota bacterium]